MLSRVLVLSGGAATILAAFLTWVTVNGLAVTLDLGLVGADLSAVNRTVAGTETSIWPAIVAAGALAAALALLGAARRRSSASGC